MSEYYDNVTDYNSARLVDVTTANATGVDALLTRGRSISGTVSLPDGIDPGWRRGIYVVASNNDGGFGSASVDPTTGRYTIAGLSAGKYVLQFAVNAVYEEGTQFTPNLVSEYYPDSLTRDGATAVDVTMTDAAGVDAFLAEGTAISGVVSLPEGAPSELLREVHVSAVGADGQSIGGGSTIDPATGAYTLERLPAGEHRIWFSASGYWNGAAYSQPRLASEYYDNSRTVDAATPVSTRDGDVANIDVELDYGARLAGSIDITALQNAVPDDVPSYGTYLMSDDGLTMYSGWGGDISEDSYSFDFAGLAPGTYRIAVTSSTWDETSSQSTPWSAQYLRNGDESTFTVKTGEELTEMTLTARPVNARISGTMTTAGFSQSPIDNVLGSALFYERIGDQWVRLPDDGARFDANQNGTTSFALAVPAGTYTVGFESDFATTGTDTREQWWDKRGSLGEATPISLSSGGVHANTDGSITPAGYAEPSTPRLFTDMPGHSFEKEVNWLAGKGITQGWEVSPGRHEFRPNAEILRGEMATFLYRLAGEPSYVPPNVSPFLDVSTDFVFYKQIAWLASTGISRGWETPGGVEFRPFAATSRDVMAAFLHRYYRPPSLATTISPFTDVTGSTVFANEILWLASEGISTGWDTGHGCHEYRPFQNG
ncbi:S-layer homology domain-containing protein [Microbacterium aurum]|uniref:S-layer homology domain-containing protein n=1 Tax=Microbacterium aurum TaxID=36805 RepID=UPI0012F4EC46|nr:S-layer homology domain-containing protein [Microbacterium aurum]MBM7828975.1 hypothetical protein [Microbacterium aurum]